MLHIEKYAADCLTFSNAGVYRVLIKYFFHRLLYIKGHCHLAVPFSFGVLLNKLQDGVRLQITEGFDIMETKVRLMKSKEESNGYELYIYCPMQRWNIIYWLDQ